MHLDKKNWPKIKNSDSPYTKLTKLKKPPKNKNCLKNEDLRFPPTENIATKKKICP